MGRIGEMMFACHAILDRALDAAERQERENQGLWEQMSQWEATLPEKERNALFAARKRKAHLKRVSDNAKRRRREKARA